MNRHIPFTWKSGVCFTDREGAKMRKIFALLYQPWTYFVFLAMFITSSFVLGILSAASTMTIGPKLGNLFGILWGKVQCWFIPCLVKIEGKEHIDKHQSYVIVANHQSYVDAFAMYGYFPVEFKWVMKKELSFIPGLGIACKKMGHIFIDRKDRQSAIDQIEKTKVYVKDGVSILFFPEGSRSRDERMLPFKKGAFHTAIQLGIPLLPITILGAGAVLPAKTTLLLPGRVRIVVHEPISVEGYSAQNIEQLMQLARTSIGTLLPADLPQQQNVSSSRYIPAEKTKQEFNAADEQKTDYYRDFSSKIQRSWESVKSSLGLDK